MRFNHVLKSCTSVDTRDGGSAGGPLAAAGAWAGAKIDSKKNREKLAVLNTLAFIIFTPRSAYQMAHYEANSELGRCLGTHRAKLRYVNRHSVGLYSSSLRAAGKGY
jgi:hypothetical protein